MAYFRTGGGGGIPAFLKTRMNAVLNKKFGTEKDYSPVYWPDDVNLMGKLEEKTASSASVCSFSDGADDVPLKNWIVTLPASLDGYSEVNGYKQGANVIDYASNLTTGTSGGLTFSVTADGGISYSGTASSTFAYVTAKFDFDIKSGQTFTFSRNTAFSYIHRITLTFSDNTTANVSISANDTSVTYTPAKDVIAVRLLVAGLTNNTAYNDTVYLMTEYGSTATAYEAYNAPTTYTANLGRTIYGGTADIVTGEGTDKGIIEVFDTIEGNVIKSQFNSFNKLNGNIAVLGTNVRITFVIESGDQSAYNRISNTYTADEQLCNLAPHSFSYASDAKHWYRNTALYLFLPVSDVGTTAESVYNYLTGLITNGTPLKFYLPYSTAPDFTFTPITPTPETALGVNNFWADEGDSGVTYRSSGTVTPIVPTLISKTITENGTYSAEDDDADGYSSVTVSVSGGTGFVPQFSETLIADNTAHASSFTLTEDYANYDMVKIVWYESATSSGFLYTTPDILDEIFSVGVGKLCINKPSTNYYACYTKSGLTWTRSNQRVIDVHEIYGVTFTNCTVQATDLYKRGASTTDKHAVTSQTSLKDYDLFMMSSIHATDGSETMPTTWLYQYPPENMSDAFSCPVPAVLQEYNANDEAFVISEYGMTAARYFMVQGIKFTSVVGEESDPNQVNELVKNDETEQEGENDAR